MYIPINIQPQQLQWRKSFHKFDSSMQHTHIYKWRKGYPSQIKHLRVEWGRDTTIKFPMEEGINQPKLFKTLTWLRPFAGVWPQNTPNLVPPIVTTQRWDTIVTAEEAMGAEGMSGKNGGTKTQLRDSKEEEGERCLLLQVLLKLC